MNLRARTNEFVDATIVTVDINMCELGSNARAIKPGGVHTLVDSMRSDGYKRVASHHPIHTLSTHHPVSITRCLIGYQSIHAPILLDIDLIIILTRSGVHAQHRFKRWGQVQSD